MQVILRSVAVLCCAFSFAGLRAASPEPDERLILRVRVVDKSVEIPRLASLDLDLAGVDVKESTADFVGDRTTYEALQAAGMFPEIVWRASEQPATEALSQYIDPVEAAQKIDFYVASYPALAKKLAIATTAEGRTEWALKISDNVTVEEDEPVVLYVAQHHAREVMTTEIAFDIVDYLLTRYATDPQVAAWVNGREIWVVPSHNPDGTNTVFTSSSGWRKNRRNNGGGSFGVDPNRNYPNFWNFCSSGGGASSAPSSDTYRGPSAASEPETQGLMQLARDHRPVESISYHTYSELVLHPYGCVEAVSSERRFLRDHSSDLAALLRNDANDGWYSNGTPWELLYEVSGEADEWLYGELGVTSTTIEASSPTQGFQPDYNTWRTGTVVRSRPGWKYLLDRIDGPSIWGHVTNACTGAALSATVGLDEIVFTNGETPRTSDPAFGRYQRLTVPGSYHLRVSKLGYSTQAWPTDVAFSAVRREVHLVPAGALAAAVVDREVSDAAGDGDAQVDPGETVALAVTAAATGGALTGLTGTLATSDPYVTVSDADGAWPAIGAGGSAPSDDGFSFSVSPAAPDGHVIVFTLTFASGQALCDATASFEIQVDTHAPSCPAIAQPLDANPGWTVQNTDAAGWAFGPPLSAGVGGPSAAHTGANVYATNLTGNYGNSSDDRLITTPFSLVGLRNTQLRFWRWLNNEAGYDIASVDVSTDGIAFTNVWSGFGRDDAWAFYRYDISAIADGQPTVYVRFRLVSDATTPAAGFYVDDVSICGDSATPAPVLAIASSSASDAGDAACSDHDAYADAGEAVAVTIVVRNDGNQAATDVSARLTSTDPRLGLAVFRAELGTIVAGGSAPAVFQVAIPEGLACLASIPLRVDVASNGGTLGVFDASLALRVNGDEAPALPDVLDTFESASGWTLTGEWQIGAPQGRGGTGAGGAGSPDPTAAVSGTNALGIDLSGAGAQIGNYENNVTTAITATSPAWSCASSTSVQLQFRRWLGSERSLYDKATIDAWDGAAWQAVWQNPDVNQSDSLWQSVAYDVTPWAAGNPAFRVRFKMTTDGSLVYCGWNIDDLRLVNGPAPAVCEGAPCAPGCSPATQIQDVRVDRPEGQAVVTWSAGADACQAAAGAIYRVYRSTDPRPRNEPATQWPQDSYFTDVTALDLDGTSSNASFADEDVPAVGAVFYYLVVPMGTNGQQGPSGWP